MEDSAEVEELRYAIVEDFTRTSGYDFGLIQSSPDDLTLQIDPILLIKLLVSPIVTEVLRHLKKRLSASKRSEPSELTNGEIMEIRKLIENFEHDKGLSRNAGLTPDLARKMADSVERVIRRDPKALIKRPKN